MSSLGPLGLSHRDYGSFSGKALASKAVGASLSGARLSPVGLLVGDTSSSSLPQVVNISSAVAIANAGNALPSSEKDANQLAPYGLSVQKRSFVAKSVGEISVDLTAAIAFTQAEELEGANATIYIAGRSILAEANFDDTVPKKGGSTKGRGYYVEIDGEIIIAETLDEAQDIIERHERFVNTPRKIRKVITDSVSLDLNAVPFKTRQRLAHRSRDVEQSTPERKRFIARPVEEKQAEIPERKRFVPRTETRIESIPERTKFIQRERKVEDPLEKILRKRRK
jgi:hypothetical protein